MLKQSGESMLSINLIVISTHNLENSLSFYSLLGLIFNKEKHDNGPIHYSCDMSGLILEIYSATPKFPKESSTRLGVCVENLTLLKESLEKNEIEFKITKDMIIVEDPDGRKIYLTEKIK